MMDNKTALVRFTENWIEGRARAIADQDYRMLRDLQTCSSDPFPDDLCEEIGMPRGSSFGEVAREIVGVIAGWGEQA